MKSTKTSLNVEEKFEIGAIQMPDGIMIEIAAIESEMDAIEKQATVDARNQIIEARNQASLILDKSIAENEEMLSAELKKAEMETIKQLDMERLTIEESCTDAKVKASERIDSAAKMILERIVADNGRH
jgi:hypothetical protein